MCAAKMTIFYVAKIVGEERIEGEDERREGGKSLVFPQEIKMRLTK